MTVCGNVKWDSMFGGDFKKDTPVPKNKAEIYLFLNVKNEWMKVECQHVFTIWQLFMYTIEVRYF